MKQTKPLAVPSPAASPQLGEDANALSAQDGLPPVQAAAAARKQAATPLSLRDQWALYVPALLMALLAAGSYWLFRATPQPLVAAPAAAAKHEADYFMRGFTVKHFAPDGRLKRDITGSEIRHFPDTDTLEVDHIRLLAYNPQHGKPLVVVADRALSNGDASEIQLFGNAQVLREAFKDAQGRPVVRMELRSEFLHAIMDTERVVTHLPVELVRGNDRFVADAMEYDNLNRVLELKGNVRGIVQPAAPKP